MTLPLILLSAGEGVLAAAVVVAKLRHWENNRAFSWWVAAAASFALAVLVPMPPVVLGFVAVLAAVASIGLIMMALDKAGYE